MLTVILMYLGVGAVAGVLAGLLGVGGGLVIVPMMVITLTWQGIPQEHIMHLALGTSLASIIFTSVSSFMAHHRRGAVQWQVVRQIVLGILLGTFLGATLASRLSTGVLKGIFIIFLYYMGIQFLMDRKPKASRTLPGAWGMFAVGLVVGDRLRLCGHRRRQSLRPFHDLLQCAGPLRHRHLRGHRLPHRHRRRRGLSGQRPKFSQPSILVLRPYCTVPY